MGRFWRQGFVTFVALLLILLAVGLWVDPSTGKSGGSKKDHPTSHAPAAKAKHQHYNRQELIRQVTVDTATVSVDCVATVRQHGGQILKIDGNDVIVYRHGHNASVSRGKRIRDGFNTPLAGRTDAARLENAKTKVCDDPLYMCTAGRFFQTEKFAGIRVANYNSWLQRLVRSSDADINNCAERLIAVPHAKKLSDKTLAKAVVANNLRFQYYASRVATLIDRFGNDGVRTQRSTRNYHLLAAGVVAGSLPEVGLNPVQESLPALQLSITLKGACAPVVVIGFNVLDSRPEEFAPPTCAPARPPSAPPGSLTPPVSSPPHPTCIFFGCVKPPSDDKTGGNQSSRTQPVGHSPPAPPPPPPAVRPPGDHNGGSGDGGAGPATGPTDTAHSGDSTTAITPVCDPFTGKNC